jgi:hypothetical protein
MPLLAPVTSAAFPANTPAMPPPLVAAGFIPVST